MNFSKVMYATHFIVALTGFIMSIILQDILCGVFAMGFYVSSLIWKVIIEVEKR